VNAICESQHGPLYLPVLLSIVAHVFALSNSFFGHRGSDEEWSVRLQIVVDHAAQGRTAILLS